MATIPHTRHQRHRKFAKLRHAKKFKSFITEQTAKFDTADDAFASGLLTFGANAANGKKVTIGATVYTFKTALSTGPAVPFEILIGVAATNSLDNLVAAINAAAGAGTTYGTGTTAHPDVAATKTSASTVTATAKVSGLSGNSIASTTDVASATFTGATLTGGTLFTETNVFDKLKENTAARVADTAHIGDLA